MSRELFMECAGWFCAGLLAVSGNLILAIVLACLLIVK